jgi:Sugar-transfer associated ATP-grasp
MLTQLLEIYSICTIKAQIFGMAPRLATTPALLPQGYLSYLKRKESRHYLKKIKHIPIDNSLFLDEEVVKKHREIWSRLSKKKVNTKWLRFYASCNGIQSPDYVPEDIYYTVIEPILNNATYALTFSDKHAYDLLYPKGLFPETLLRNINGACFNKDYQPVSISTDDDLLKIMEQENRLITKPSLDSGGGNNVFLFEKYGEGFITKSGQILNREFLDNTYKNDFLIQKTISNHPFFAQFNQTSLNTIRALVIKNPNTGEVASVSFYLRVGRPGSTVDSGRQGGLAIGIAPNGDMKNYAVDKTGKKTLVVNGNDLTATKYTVPFMPEIIARSKEIARMHPHHRILGLDLAVDPDNHIRCIEVNNDSVGINPKQLIEGPLFGEMTEEIIDYCLQHSKFKVQSSRFKVQGSKLNVFSVYAKLNG